MGGFRNDFSDINNANYVNWNNKDIKIDNKPIFYKKKKFADWGIVYVNDLLFNLDDVRSLECLKNKGLESNFLTWSALRLTVPKDKVSSFPRVKFNAMIFKYNNTEFGPYSGESKFFMHCRLPTKLNIRKGSLPYQPICSFQKRCRKCFRPPITYLVKFISGLFNINY